MRTLNRTRKLNLIKQELKQENRMFTKMWTLEGITFIAFVATLVSSYFLFALSTWEQISLLPKRNMQYGEIQAYQAGRMEMFENFRKAWTVMRNQYALFVYDCANTKMSAQKLADYAEKNRTSAYNVMDVTASIFQYYFGSSIHDIYLSELNWYLNYANKCPVSYGMSYLKVNENLYHRQDILMSLMLRKVYNPYINNLLYDNPYYASF